MSDESKKPKRKRRCIRFSLRSLLIVVSLLCVCLAILSGWIRFQINAGNRDYEYLDYVYSGSEPAWANAFFETDYVIIPDWFADNFPSASEPFLRVTEIDFMLDNLYGPDDILPFAEFVYVKYIRIDMFPESDDGIAAFRKFKNLKSILVLRPGDEKDRAKAKRLLPGIVILDVESDPEDGYSPWLDPNY